MEQYANQHQMLAAYLSPTKERVLKGRHEAVWAAMEDQGYDAIVLAGRGLITQYGYLEYVTGWCQQVRLGYAVVVKGKPPIMVMPTASDAWYARQATGLADVRAAGQGDVISEQDSLPHVIASIIEENGVANGHVGIAGMRHIVPMGDYEMLKEALPEARISDATKLIGDIKRIKNAEEQAEEIRSAEIADAGLAAFAHAAKIGSTGWEMRGVIENEVRRRGAQHVLIMVGIGPYFNITPGYEGIQEGDLASVYVEITGPNGFWVEKASLFGAGDIGDVKRDMAQVTIDSHKAARDALVVGNTSADVAAALETVAEPAQVDYGIWHGHGIGIDHDTPVVTKTDPTPLQAGMVMAIHPNFVNREETLGASVADTFIVQEQGPAVLTSKYEQRLFNIGEELA